jgi:hypothetical protein
VIIGRVPGCAERFAWSKASRRCSGVSSFICPVAIVELETSYSPHAGQKMLTTSIVAAICSALAPQTRQFMCWLRWLRWMKIGARRTLGPREVAEGGRTEMPAAAQRQRGHAPVRTWGKKSGIFAPGVAASRTHKY